MIRIRYDPTLIALRILARCIVCGNILAAVLSSVGHAQGLTDSFDGSFDGTWEITQGNGTLEIVDGRLILTPAGRDYILVRPTASDGSGFTLQDISIQALFKISEGVLSQVGFHTRGQAYFPAIDNEQEMGLLTANGQWIAGNDSVPFNVGTQDIQMRFDAIGSDLSFSAWPASDPSNVIEIGANDSDFLRSGEFGFWIRAWAGRLGTIEFDDVVVLSDAPGPTDPTVLQAGDADQDYDFDQVDLVQVLAAAKYLTGEPATWGEGDWNGAPGGSPGDPPPGNGLFDQVDIIAALSNGFYLTGPYPAVQPDGQQADARTSIVYNAAIGELAVNAPVGTELTSINIDSATGLFTGQPAANLGGSFDNDSDTNVFKATFGTSFGSLSFGKVAEPGLDEEFLLGDLTVVGSLQGGGGLGDVDLVYVPVPEPSALALSIIGLLGVVAASRRR